MNEDKGKLSRVDVGLVIVVITLAATITFGLWFCKGGGC